MHLIYIDDSGDTQTRVFSALAVPLDHWRACFEQIRDFRRELRKQRGVFVKVEFHATEFVSGRGRISSQTIGKYERSQLFRRTLLEITRMPGVRLFNAVAARASEPRLYERLLNRINRTLLAWGSRGLLISDEGKDYTSLVRRMGAHNPIPSMYGGWPSGPTKNIVLAQIYEDPVFRKSHRSYFIQIADFCAYALLRSERQVASKNRYGIHRAFDILTPICTPECFRNDPRRLGIVRA
jgi:Protein of unknown function (DUF3800)